MGGPAVSGYILNALQNEGTFTSVEYGTERFKSKAFKIRSGKSTSNSEGTSTPAEDGLPYVDSNHNNCLSHSQILIRQLAERMTLCIKTDLGFTFT